MMCNWHDPQNHLWVLHLFHCVMMSNWHDPQNHLWVLHLLDCVIMCKWHDPQNHLWVQPLLHFLNNNHANMPVNEWTLILGITLTVLIGFNVLTLGGLNVRLINTSHQQGCFWRLFIVLFFSFLFVKHVWSTQKCQSYWWHHKHQICELVSFS